MSSALESYCRVCGRWRVATGSSIIWERIRTASVIFTAAEGRKPAATTEEFAALKRSQIAYSGLVTLSPDPGRRPASVRITLVASSGRLVMTHG
jgi:hypothetical protein